jgi:6-phosphogluconolactonase
MDPIIKIFDTPELLAKSVANEIGSFISARSPSNGEYSLVLSGGSTPRLLFRELVHLNKKNPISWENVKLFWGDERSVPPDHPESNFGMTRRELLDHISIPEENVIRIRGENAPKEEAQRYSDEIRRSFGIGEGKVPVFDWILLGLGTDGHTASLFPESDALKVQNQICVATKHPTSGQDRLTLTLPVINRAERVTFFIVGKEKSKIISEIFNHEINYTQYPAVLINPESGILEWYLDKKASQLLNV